MTYITHVNRVKFEKLITDTISVIKEGGETLYVKGEYFGFWCNRVIKRFMANPDYSGNTFNSLFFNETKKKTLSNTADSIAALINRGDPIASAGELSYVVCAVLFALADDNYGWRCYLRGMVSKINESVISNNNGTQRDATMAFRRHLVVRGVMADVLFEFDKMMSNHRDHELSNNGPIWIGDQLNIDHEEEV